jgi:transposase InsO family protein
VLTFVERTKHRHAVDLVLRALTIPRSTFYHWRHRADSPSDRAEVDLGLLSVVFERWEASGRLYGSDRIWGGMRVDGIEVSRKRIARLMAEQGWQGAFLPKGWKGGSTVPEDNAEKAPDRVERDFWAAAPDRLWLADASRLVYRGGLLWMAAIRDVFANRIVGWATGPSCDTDLIERALSYAIWSRDIEGDDLVHHSDHGSNYTSIRFSQLLSDNGIKQSMGSVGDSYDNALMENFWSTLKIELIYRRRWDSAEQLETELFLYVDGWYNTQRIQKRLGYRSPAQFEEAWREGMLTEDDLIPHFRSSGN